MASVVEGAGKGAAAGSAAGPWGAAIGGLIGAGSTLWANEEEKDAADKAKAAYAEQANKGINQLYTGREETKSNFQPYLDAGKQGAEGTVNSIQNRERYKDPTLSNVTPGSVISDYLNPSAAYATRVAGDAITAKALAGGSAGGGMLRALNENANKMALENYNNAYQQALDTGTQRFGQENQIYKNRTDFDQSQIGNYQTLMNTGTNAASNLGTITSNYDTNINTSYKDLGNSQAGGEYLKGSSNSAATQQGGNLIGQGVQGLVGSYLSQNGEDE